MRKMRKMRGMRGMRKMRKRLLILNFEFCEKLPGGASAAGGETSAAGGFPELTATGVSAKRAAGIRVACPEDSPEGVSLRSHPRAEVPSALGEWRQATGVGFPTEQTFQDEF
jgi:hypothetical protein